MIQTMTPSQQSSVTQSLNSSNALNKTITNYQYACSHCMTGFKLEEQYKTHYKTDLHKYNLKRRLLDLMPVSEDQFNLQFNRESSVTSAHSNLLYCIPCGKNFVTRKTLNQHLKSKKHAEKQIQVQANWQQQQQKNKSNLKDSESDTSASKFMEARCSNEDPSVCLFCDHKSQTLKLNDQHMQLKHGFFVIHQEFLSDMRGLITFLGKIINEQKACIKCELEFKTAEGVKKHMLDKQHCFMQNLSAEDPTFLIFYDFKKKLEQPKVIELPSSEEEDDITEESKQKKKDQNIEKLVQKVENQDENQLLEVESNISDWEELQEGLKNGMNKEQLEEMKKNEFQQFLTEIQNNVAQVQPDGQVRLANGKVLGHRQYKKYYKMYYRDIQEYSERANRLTLEGTQKQFQIRQCPQNATSQYAADKEEEQNLEIQDGEETEEKKKKKAKYVDQARYEKKAQKMRPTEDKFQKNFLRKVQDF